MQTLNIQGFTYEQRHGLLADLTAAFGNCGGWILERKTLSPTNMEFSVEIQLRAILDLYAAMVASPASNSPAPATKPSPSSAPGANICTCPPNSARSSPSAWKSPSSTIITLTHFLSASSGTAWYLRWRK